MRKKISVSIDDELLRRVEEIRSRIFVPIDDELLRSADGERNLMFSRSRMLEFLILTGLKILEEVVDEEQRKRD